MTKLLQPLDISVNRSFKAVLRRLWESWMSEGEHSFTKTGRMRRAEFGEVAKWVSEAWHSISDKTIVAGFRKAGLIPGVADVESDSSESEDDSDEPAVLQPEIAALFVSDSEEEDFDGFDLSE
uniref:Putative pogo transposable element n=1 Tax=Rhipicephalus microplus TaxID=6941 RepID=A0A6M2CNS2_RHIMP